MLTSPIAIGCSFAAPPADPLSHPLVPRSGEGETACHASGDPVTPRHLTPTAQRRTPALRSDFAAILR